ncbi:hypothetical protein YIM73518_17670 [Thermus brockianus]|jgi:hypothetical protein
MPRYAWMTALVGAGPAQQDRVLSPQGLQAQRQPLTGLTLGGRPALGVYAEIRYQGQAYVDLAVYTVEGGRAFGLQLTTPAQAFAQVQPLFRQLLGQVQLLGDQGQRFPAPGPFPTSSPTPSPLPGPFPAPVLPPGPTPSQVLSGSKPTYPRALPWTTSPRSWRGTGSIASAGPTWTRVFIPCWRRTSSWKGA